MIDLTALWPRRPARQPWMNRVAVKRPPARRKTPASATPASTPLPRPSHMQPPRRSPTLTVVSAGLVLALLLAAINAVILFSASAPQAAEAHPATASQMVASPAAAKPTAAMPALAGRTHNATLIMALRERAADAAGHRPLIFALLLMQALVMGGTTLYLWKKAGRVFAPAHAARKRRRAVSPSADGYARG